MYMHFMYIMMHLLHAVPGLTKKFIVLPEQELGRIFKILNKLARISGAVWSNSNKYRSWQHSCTYIIKNILKKY